MTVHHRDAREYASPALLRRRGLRVWCIGPWVIVYTPRNHELRDL